MKRSYVVLILVVLAGCSGLPPFPFLQTPVPSDAPVTVTPQQLPPSNTPDLFVINTAEPTTTPLPGTQLATDTPLPTFTPTNRPTITLEPVDPMLFTPSPNIFIMVQRSTSQIVWGYGCEGSRTIRFTAQVIAARRLRYVTLWYRLQDKYSGHRTDWGGGAIFSDNDRGVYFYDLDLSQIRRHRQFVDAWFQYQLVASTAAQTVLGRSIVSRNEVSLTHCSVFSP